VHGPNIFLSLFCARFMRAYFPVRDKIIFFIRKLEQFGAAKLAGEPRLPGLIATQIFISGVPAPLAGYVLVQ
jgi:hypothetical protein